MSIPTTHPAPHDPTPEDRRDHATGRADAYDAHHRGATPDELQARLEWMEDPRVSAYTAAYLRGYRAYIGDVAAEAFHQRLTDTARAYEEHTPRGVIARLRARIGELEALLAAAELRAEDAELRAGDMEFERDAARDTVGAQQEEFSAWRARGQYTTGGTA